MKIYTAILHHSTAPEVIVAATTKTARDRAKALANLHSDKLACVVDRTPVMAAGLYKKMLSDIELISDPTVALALKTLAYEWFVKATKA